MHDLQASKRFVEKLRNVGCNVAIDDFGAGFTSFRNIRELPINILKLDGSFCANLKANPENQYFVKASIEMGHRFGMKTVAEWVESQDDADTLRSWNIDYLQGNFLGEPSLTAPWQKTADVGFDLSPESSSHYLAPLNAVPAETVPEPMIAIAVATLDESVFFAEAPVLETNDAPAEILEVFASPLAGPMANLITEVAEAQSDPMESVEADLSRLWAALDILNQQFAAPSTPINDEELRRAG